MKGEYIFHYHSIKFVCTSFEYITENTHPSDTPTAQCWYVKPSIYGRMVSLGGMFVGK